jgi:hypothetical protein
MKRSMDDLLRDTLRARAADPTAACLDPETAAAFVDGTLSARARSGAEAHVADCPRCQAVLAALVRSTPPPIERAWWRRPAVAWLVPMTVAATAFAIWISVPDLPNLAPVQTRRDEAPPIESLPVHPPPAGPAALQAPSQIGSAAAARSTGPEQVRVRETAASAKARLVPQTPDASANSDAQQVAAASLPAAATPPPATAAPQASRPDAERLASQDRQAVAQTPRATAVEPNADPAVAAEPVRPSALAETITVSGQAPVVDVSTVVFSSGVSRWRIGASGAVQHSADNGSTWRTQATGVNVTLAAGSSPSPSVCWLVGPAGIVLITVDEGRSWRRVPFPAATDLVAVKATDDRTATVVASDGRAFTTSDGGENWRR